MYVLWFQSFASCRIIGTKKKTRGPEVLRCSPDTGSQDLNNDKPDLLFKRILHGSNPNDKCQDLRILPL